MSATLRLKPLLFIAAALALVAMGLVAALSTASPARADDSTGGECIPTEDTLSAWANAGAPFTVHDGSTPTDPDGTDETSTTNLVRFVLVDTVKHVTQEAVEGTEGTPSQWWNFSPNNNQGPLVGTPAFPTDPRGTWQGPHTEGGPSQELTGTFQQGGGNSPWFHREPGTQGTPGQDEVSHTDTIWQQQTRTFTEGVECDDPAVCPDDSDHPGMEIPVGQTEDEVCNEDDDEVCPDDSDHPGMEIPEGQTEDEVCNDDDVDPGPTCEEDPTQEHCDENKPPVVVPDDGTTPNNGPTVRGVQATAPTTVAAAVAGTPAARVPTAVNAGLAPQQELAGNGRALGILGIATLLFGAALVGLTFRPRRRISSEFRART